MVTHAARVPQPREDRSPEIEARIRREAEIIAQGHAEIDAGHGIELEDLERWLDALDVDEDTPLPVAGATVSRI